MTQGEPPPAYISWSKMKIKLQGQLPGRFYALKWYSNFSIISAKVKVVLFFQYEAVLVSKTASENRRLWQLGEAWVFDQMTSDQASGGLKHEDYYHLHSGQNSWQMTRPNVRGYRVGRVNFKKNFCTWPKIEFLVQKMPKKNLGALRPIFPLRNLGNRAAPNS